jgi:hypothetical protein
LKDYFTQYKCSFFYPPKRPTLVIKDILWKCPFITFDWSNIEYKFTQLTYQMGFCTKAIIIMLRYEWFINFWYLVWVIFRVSMKSLLYWNITPGSKCLSFTFIIISDAHLLIHGFILRNVQWIYNAKRDFSVFVFNWLYTYFSWHYCIKSSVFLKISCLCHYILEKN